MVYAMLTPAPTPVLQRPGGVSSPAVPRAMSTALESQRATSDPGWTEAKHPLENPFTKTPQAPASGQSTDVRAISGDARLFPVVVVMGWFGHQCGHSDSLR